MDELKPEPRYTPVPAVPKNREEIEDLVDLRAEQVMDEFQKWVKRLEESRHASGGEDDILAMILIFFTRKIARLQIGAETAAKLQWPL